MKEIEYSLIIIKARSNCRMEKWRDEVLIRDNHTCKKCRITYDQIDEEAPKIDVWNARNIKKLNNYLRTHRLEAHHRIPIGVILRKGKINSLEDIRNSKELWDVNNGITLCYKCHKQVHKEEGYGNRKNKN